MIVAGCLALLVLPLVGLVCGGVLAGQQGAIWGALAGFAVALVLCGGSAYATFKIGQRR
jgi:hypothetical protein